MTRPPAGRAPGMTGGQRAALVVATVALATDMLVYGLAVPVLPTLADRYGASSGALGVMFASYALTMLAVSPVVGVWLDRRGPRLPMLAGLAGLAVSCVLFALASSLTLLVVARVLQGASAAVSWTAAFALIAARFDAPSRGAALGTAFAGVGLGTLLGPPLGGLLFEHVGERAPFLFAAVIAAVDGVLRYRLVDDERPVDEALARASGDAIERARTPRARAVLAAPGAWTLAALTATGAFALAYFEPVLPGRMTELAGSDATTVGLVFALAAVVASAIPPLAGAMTDRVSARVPLLAGAVLLLGGGLVLAVASGAWAFAAGLTVLAAGAALVLTPTLALVAAIADDTDPPAYGAAYALYTVAYVAGLAAGPLIAGALTDAAGFPAAARAAACGLAAAAAVLAVAASRRRRTATSTTSAEPLGVPQHRH